MSPRYAWPEDLTERGAKWQDYKNRGFWTHSLLWAEDGTLIASCFAQSNRSGCVTHVPWSTEFGDEGQCGTRAEAKREARMEARRFLSQNSDS